MTTRQRGREDGFTIIELMVTISLLSVLGAVMLAGVQNNHALHRTTVDESFGLADVKTVVERLGRDVRSARSLYPGATESQLVLWVDKNSDYLQSSDEIITWQLVQQAEDGVQYNVIRSTEGGEPVIQARTVVSDIAFCYWKQSADPTLTDCTGSLPASAAGGGLSVEDAAATRLVTTTTTYDFQPGAGVSERQVSFSSRLRNVE